MDYRTAFARRLRELRQSRKLSLQQLGDAINRTNQAVSLFEKGKSSPSFEALLLLADYFDVSLDYLTGRSDDPNSHKSR